MARLYRVDWSAPAGAQARDWALSMREAREIADARPGAKISTILVPTDAAQILELLRTEARQGRRPVRRVGAAPRSRQ